MPAGNQQTARHRNRINYALFAVWGVLFRRVDAVFCGHLFMAPLAWLIARLKRAKLIIQMHGIEAWQRPTLLRRMATESADLILSVSRDTRARVLGWAAVEPERVLVLPNTIGASFTPGCGAGLREAWGLQGKRVLLSVGRLSAQASYKGNDRVIRAIPSLLAAGHDVIYVVIGDGDDRDRLQALADHKGVAGRVRFMGAVDAPTLIQAYRMSDLFVMPSTGEGFGIAFVEAMACGTPAIGLATGGATDSLADGELGECAHEQELAAAICRALDHPKQGASAAAAVQHRFGRARFEDGVMKVVSRLAEVPTCH
jgi:phosphatidylinositol alpha-1,6-mannosyltransferase